jgi:calcineurin-like phosphoesterase family protein
MNNAILDNFNFLLGPGDTLIHLGDVAMGKIAESLPLMNKIRPGVRKVLVPGNHDRVFSGNKESQRVKFESEYYKVFDEIWAEQRSILIQGIEFILCHFPYEGDSHDEDRYVDKRPVDNGKPLIHGHVHSKEKIVNGQIHVGVDAWNFRPVSENETVDIYNSLAS